MTGRGSCVKIMKVSFGFLSRRMCVKCLLILSVKMIFSCDGFTNSQIDKTSKDGRCHA